MAIYQEKINPQTGGSVPFRGSVQKLGIIIPERVYMKYVLEYEKPGFEVTLNDISPFLIGKTFIYETDQTSQDLITSLSFPTIAENINWNDEDYINNDLQYIIVDYVTKEE